METRREPSERVALATTLDLEIIVFGEDKAKRIAQKSRLAHRTMVREVERVGQNRDVAVRNVNEGRACFPVSRNSTNHSSLRRRLLPGASPGFVADAVFQEYSGVTSPDGESEVFGFSSKSASGRRARCGVSFRLRDLRSAFYSICYGRFVVDFLFFPVRLMP